MQIKVILYNPTFLEQFYALPIAIQRKTFRAEDLFRENAFHPSLRLHKLKGKLAGLWSISLDRKYRIVFRSLENGTVLLISIGTHNIYEDLS